MRAQHQATRSLALGALIGFCIPCWRLSSGIQSKWFADSVTDAARTDTCDVGRRLALKSVLEGLVQTDIVV